MAYTVKNFRTKKALKQALAERQRYLTLKKESSGLLGFSPLSIGAVLLSKEFPNGEPPPIRVYQPGPFGPDVRDGSCALEGPHYPEPHRWYAEAVVQNGCVVKVR